MLDQYPYMRLNGHFTRRPTRQQLIIILTAVLLIILSVSLLWHHGTAGNISLPFNPWQGYTIRPLPYFPKDLEKEVSPSTPAYSAVLLYLISWRRAAELITSLSYVHANLPLKHPWPIVLFHPGDFDDVARQTDFKRRLFAYIDGGHDVWKFVDRLEFQRLEFSLPEGVPEDPYAIDAVFADRYPGYQHMCRFFTSQIFDHPRLQNVTYYLRLDTDSYLYDKACTDPIDTMHQDNLVYGYRIFEWDPAFVTHGMYDFVQQYAEAHPGTLQRMHNNGWDLPDPSRFDDEYFPLYYNNFEIVKLDAFRTPRIREFLDAITSDPLRFYKYRWGDAPLRFAMVTMFFDKMKQVKEFCDIPYVHYMKAKNNCGCES